MRFKQSGLLTKVVILILLVYMATSLLNLRGQIEETQQLRDSLAQKVSGQQVENQKLADAVEHSDDPAMMEQVAREKGYVRQGEVLYIDVAN